jgi:hypothetical protein
MLWTFLRGAILVSSMSLRKNPASHVSMVLQELVTPVDGNSLKLRQAVPSPAPCGAHDGTPEFPGLSL